MSKRNRKKYFQTQTNKKGLPPGSPIYSGEVRTSDPIINLTTYRLEEVTFYKNINVSKLKNLESDKYHWIELVGVHHVDIVTAICTIFDIHPLTIEDLVNTTIRPKFEVYEDYIHAQIKMLKNEEPTIIVEEENIGLVLKNNIVLSFREVSTDFFDVIYRRLDDAKSRARRKKADYLFFLLIDLVVDYYMEIVNLVERTNDELESSIMIDQRQEQLAQIQVLKSDLLYLKSTFTPTQEGIVKILRSETNLIEKINLKYFEDLNDHLTHINDGIKLQREMVMSHRELYMSLINLNMGNVIKVLTIVSSIFIPLTFLVGLYGMNFDNMPELRAKNGYFILLCVMFCLSMLMLYYFKRKKWL